jgi:hypothetical protein
LLTETNAISIPAKKPMRNNEATMAASVIQSILQKYKNENEDVLN